MNSNLHKLNFKVMRVLQVVQTNIESLGLSPTLEPFNRQVLGVLTVDVLGDTLLWIFLLHDAESSKEYMTSISYINAFSNIILSRVSTIFVTKKIFSFLDGVNELVNESKY